MTDALLRRRSMELVTAVAVQRGSRRASRPCAVDAAHGPAAMGDATCGRCQLVQAYGPESAEVDAFDAIRREAGR